MAWINDFLERLFPTRERYGSVDTVVIDIPAELYYKELAVHTACSMIANAISRSEIKTFKDGKPIRGSDYYLLNVSPNNNETSSIFWHKVINRVVRNGEALVVDAGGALYCADSFTRELKQPIKGDVYSQVQVGDITMYRKFRQKDSYMFRLDNINIKTLIDGMYEHYGKILSAAAKSLRMANSQKYKLHIEGAKAGDTDFNKEFEEFISKQLKTYMDADNAVYPEFDGYKLEGDPVYGKATGSSADFIAMKKELDSMVARAFHIPEVLLTGNINSFKDVMTAFLTFGVDPMADMITEGLNKRGGAENFVNGNYYKVDTSQIIHRDLFDLAVAVMNFVSSGIYSIDEVRQKLGDEQIGEEWSQKHFITKNFEAIERYLKTAEEGGENNEQKVLPDSNSGPYRRN